MSGKSDIMSGKSDMTPQETIRSGIEEGDRGAREDNLVAKQEEGGGTGF